MAQYLSPAPPSKDKAIHNHPSNRDRQFLAKLRSLDTFALEQLHEKLIHVACPDARQHEGKPNVDTSVSICFLGDSRAPRFDLLDQILQPEEGSWTLPDTLRPGSLPPFLPHFITYANDPDEDGIRFEQWADYEAPCEKLTEVEFSARLRELATYNRPRRFRIAARFIADAGRIDWILPPPGLPTDVESFSKAITIPNLANCTKPAVVAVAESEEGVIEAWSSLRELSLQAAQGCPSMACCSKDPTARSGEAPVFGVTEAALEIRLRCQKTSAWFPSPDQYKETLLRSISGAWQAANAVNLQCQSESDKKQPFAEFLEECELDWREMFLDERRFAIDSLRLDMVAHHLQKSAMIVSSERSRVVENYAREQLLPRLDLFLRRQSLRLNRLMGTQLTANSGGLMQDQINNGEAKLWFQATIASLPVMAGSLMGLAGGNLPRMAVPPLTGVFSLNPLPELHGLDYFNPVKLAESAGSKAGQEIAKQIGPALQSAIEINTTILKFLVWFQVTTSVAQLIQGGLQIAAGISVREAEKMICRLLEDCESRWPRIRAAMEDAVGTPNPNGVKALLAKANKIVSMIDDTLEANPNQP